MDEKKKLFFNYKITQITGTCFICDVNRKSDGDGDFFYYFFFYVCFSIYWSLVIEF